ncbi:DUF2306 domain-containing protein [Larkinella insperata]|uniref:DUF2306 domain-containing protein n=1 Tax=Larkinella insperata TaxID=332158 RepID=A0ABW3QHC5_9BACT|nr:DUF2306 domain-containing protein [Larkinella insperata]
MTQLLTDTLPQPATPTLSRFSRNVLDWSGILLVATVWVSAALFGLYILAFYAAALYEGNMERWNEVLPKLYERGTTTATSGIGLHFATGGIILVLGSIQLIKAVRDRFPALHRWIGRLYVLSSLLAALGGLTFIVLKGTIGGLVMNLGFGLYGVLTFVAAIETYRHAAAGRMEKHRRWALRLYALAIGSWLFRMDYGFWLMLADGLGHTRSFTGPFDQVMAFFFYIPNLLVAEAFGRARQYQASTALRLGASLLLLSATGFLLIGTYYFTRYYWGPEIVGWLMGT